MLDLTNPSDFYVDPLCCSEYTQARKMKKGRNQLATSLSWALTDSNRRPSACKADALNQLS